MAVQPASGYFKGVKTDNGITEKSSLSLALSSCAALDLTRLHQTTSKTTTTVTTAPTAVATASINAVQTPAASAKASEMMDMLLSMLQTTQVCCCISSLGMICCFLVCCVWEEVEEGTTKYVVCSCSGLLRVGWFEQIFDSESCGEAAIG